MQVETSDKVQLQTGSRLHFSPKLIELASHEYRNVQLFLPNTTKTKQEMDVLHRAETKTRKRDEPAWGAGALAALTWGLELLPGTIISYNVQQQANVWTLHPPKWKLLLSAWLWWVSRFHTYTYKPVKGHPRNQGPARSSLHLRGCFLTKHRFSVSNRV